jgi:DNA polymerase-3 subunit gamma/tau
LAELLSLLQRVALAQILPDAIADDSAADPEELRRLAERLPPEDVQLFYQIALLGRRDLPLAPDPRGGFEMVLLRMLCFRPAAIETTAPVSHALAATPRHASAVPVPAVATVRRSPPPGLMSTPPAPGWSALVAQLQLTGIAKQVAMHCALVERDGSHFHLALEPGHAQMLNDMVKERIQTALEQDCGGPVTLKFQIGDVTAATPADQQKRRQAERHQAAAERVAQDPHVRDMQEMFDARIAAIHPLDETDG